MLSFFSIFNTVSSASRFPKSSISVTFSNSDVSISDSLLVLSSFYLSGSKYSLHFFCPSTAESLLDPDALWSRDSQTQVRNPNLGYESPLMGREL